MYVINIWLCFWREKTKAWDQICDLMRSTANLNGIIKTFLLYHLLITPCVTYDGNERSTTCASKWLTEVKLQNFYCCIYMYEILDIKF